MKIKVCEKLKIENPTPAIVSWCKENLVLDNPEYYKRERMGKWTGNIPRDICLYEQVGNELWLPFGCLRDIWNLCVRGVQWEVEIGTIRSLKYTSNINPYPYQEKAIQEGLRLKNGVLVMPCGSGKTQSGLEIIARLGGRALWLTHTQDLLNQSKKRAESVLMCGDNDRSPAAFGFITAGKVAIGTHITFATIQTLCKLDLSQYKDMWDIIIVDECQHCAGSPTRVTQFYKVISQLSARYKIGLTATPKRADGLEKSMFALLGGIIHEVKKEDVKHTTCPIKVKQVQTGWYPDCECVLMGDGTIDYSKVIENMVHDEDRFNKVFNELANLPKDEPIIVLANRVEYLQKLCDEYNLNRLGIGICISGTSNTKATKEKRKLCLEKLNNGEIDCVFATYQLAKEGLDVPNLKYIIFATPEKDETTVVQSVGRVGRKADGKEYGTVIDFVDDFGMYKGWAKKRENYYKKIDAEII